MIIIEGVDKSGKTTLAFELKKKFGLDIKKYGVPDGDPLSGYINELQELHRPKIYDRFLYGEYPYSKVKRPDQVFMDTHSFIMLELALLTKPHLVIWANPGIEEIQKNFLRLGDDYVDDLVELMHIYEHYEKIMHQSMCNVVHYDYRDPGSTEGIFTYAKEQIHWDEWRRYEDWHNNGMYGIGTRYPRYLFIRDRFPFTSRDMMWNYEGKYLIDRIIAAGIPLKHCHFTSTIGKGYEKITLKQITMMNPARVIALGNSAHEFLSYYQDDLHELGIEMAKVPSPWWWGRKKPDQSDEYEEGLRLSCGIFEPTLATRHSAPSLED